MHPPSPQAILTILQVAPQPFSRPRGTPFSVLHRVRSLVKLGHRVGRITYPFGENIAMSGLRSLRSSRAPGVRGIKIGRFIGKLLLDIPLFCAPLARSFKTMYVYDMHSSLPQQLDNFKSFNAGPLKRLFNREKVGGPAGIAPPVPALLESRWRVVSSLGKFRVAAWSCN